MSIEQLKKKLESERLYLNSLTMTQGGPEHTFVNRFDKGFEAATNRLLPLLKKAIEMAEFYNGLYVFSESDDDSEQLHIDKPWRYSSGKRAREFLSEFTKMAEINKEFGE